MRTLLIFLAVNTFFCTLSLGQKAAHNSHPKINTTSAHLALNIAEKISSDEKVSPEEWEELFTSPGYQQYLIYRDSALRAETIKECFYLVFNDQNKAKLDSLAALPIQFDQSFLKLYTLTGVHKLKNRTREARGLLEKTNFDEIIREANALALSHLPDFVKETSPSLPDVYFVSREPEAQVANAIVFDVSFLLGDINVIRTILAHEFHHVYRGEYLVEYKEDPLMLLLDTYHREGFADLIDKKYFQFPKSMREIEQLLGEAYKASPSTLMKIDSTLLQHLEKEIDFTEYENQIYGYMQFNGHDAGYYMASLIRDILGIEALIKSFADPVLFVEEYNKAAKQKKGEYVFSDTFMSYLRKKM